MANRAAEQARQMWEDAVANTISATVLGYQHQQNEHYLILLEELYNIVLPLAYNNYLPCL